MPEDRHDHPHTPSAGHSHAHTAGASAHEHAQAGKPAHVPSSQATGHSPDSHGHGHEPGPASTSSHGHEHAHHGEDAEHTHPPGLFGRLTELIPFLHGHKHGELPVDEALESSDRGIAALRTSLLILGATALFQVVIVIISGSAALLSDTVHNFTDAMTAVPLWVAFSLGRRRASARYTYGYGRAEDVAGIFIILVILSSAIFAAYESYDHLVHPRSLNNIEWVIVAAITGFIGNETVALLRIRVGREIGSAALIADGQHARADGLTSLAVLGGALGVLAGFRQADPIVGMLIAVAILFIIKDVSVSMWRRLMDAIEPEVVQDIEGAANSTIAGVEGVHGISNLRVRWLGHKLQAEMSLTVDEDMSTRLSHNRAEEVRHALFHARPQLTSVIIHVEPDGHDGDDPHHLTAHHTP